MTGYTIVVPTTGRPSLSVLLHAIDAATGPRPDEIVVVDDRPDGAPLELPGEPTVLRSGGRGPAAARNLGWRHARTEWIAFLDDDVVVTPDWPDRLARDLARLGAEVGASCGVITVPLPESRRPNDNERGTAGLATARWITADMAYRRSALAATGGFDESFPRAYREDADLALRVSDAGFSIVDGERVTVHPVRPANALASVRAQAGNASDALMRRKHGRGWRRRTGAGHGRLPLHAVTTGAALTAVGSLLAGKRRATGIAGALWAGLTAEFAARRIIPGPRDPAEVGRMLLTSVLIPPAACAHRLRGEVRARRTHAPAAVLFDRDDTLIEDGPYLADAARVRPMPTAEDGIRLLRRLGVPLGVVSNQSGVARGLIKPHQLAEVNDRVDDLLGPFDTWQVCVHGEADGCECRKPKPGLIRAAADALGVDVRRCVVIGDTGGDVAAAEAAGATGILVPTARTRRQEVAEAKLVAADLRDAVRLALGAVR